ncbi:hypothetical protein TOPH_07042 [Tolypocladium ophioglossoides CBS 100239]|uniref:Uncharacterized protein n=1 Tax=Tolypocladium ophioglossoides (strain CBS 100239) TaxID=1163406 RepID=A0A0L0N361_TOLOC|nr:hypothetical protein TOPH_07042 [Tolypocladium ophioglossoides CBS 100239]
MSKMFDGTMFKTLAPAALFSFAAANLYQVPLGSSEFPTDDDFTPRWDYDSCTISRSTAFEVLKGPNTFSSSPSDPINSVKITPAINKTNWEQWEFDGIPYGHFPHHGDVLSEPLVLLLRQGKSAHGNVHDYLGRQALLRARSIILDCPGYTYGIWNSSGKSYSFYTTKDLKYTKLVFDSPGIRGTYKLSATTPPVHADGSAPDPEGGKRADAAQISPDLYYSVPVAGGQVEMDAVLGSGKKLSLSGRGGSARLWAKQGWLGLSESWVALRAWAGPYTIAYWHVVSRVGVDTGKKFSSGHLFYNDQLLVGTRVGNISETEDYVRDTYNFDGEISGTDDDKNTGVVFEFASPAQDKK